MNKSDLILKELQEFYSKRAQYLPELFTRPEDVPTTGNPSAQIEDINVALLSIQYQIYKLEEEPEPDSARKIEDLKAEKEKLEKERRTLMQGDKIPER